MGFRKIDFFSPTPQLASRPQRWAVGPPPIACPIPLCPHEAGTVSNLFQHMAAQHPHDVLHVAGYTGYKNAPIVSST